MSAAPTVARARPRKTMSETGDPAPEGSAVRVEDIERALVLAREVAAATAKGGSANLRMEHLQALFANGHGPVAPARMQAALQAAGLSAEPPLTESPDTVELRVERRRAALSPKGGAGGAKRAAPPPAEPAADEPQPRLSGVAAYQAMTGRTRRPKPKAEPPAAVSLGDAERVAAAEHAEQNTAPSIAALMPALILPVLAASFLGPLFGAAFAALALLASALLSRPGALADGKLGPIRMPASLARSFLLLSAGVALGALATSLALVAAGGSDTSSDPNAPIEQKKTTPTTTAPRTTPPAPPAQTQQQRQEDAAVERRAERRRAQRRREARAKARARERAREREATPPSGTAPDTGTTTP
jgi:hypothetical protein